MLDLLAEIDVSLEAPLREDAEVQWDWFCSDPDRYFREQRRRLQMQMWPMLRATVDD